MPSLLPGYEYDIFISYRQKDNKGHKWVTTFIEALKTELEATFKEDLSIYFDEIPHDGLLETHQVDKSLEGKLKCLIFIPIISQTYCDAKSFAWKQEFCAFNKFATIDSYGRDIKLSNGNVASRILPVKIHGLDAGDQKSLETEIGSVLRAVDFIYREPGVNRPLNPDDDASENLNKTRYRNQVNKVANTIKDLLVGMQNFGKTDFIEAIVEKPAFGEAVHGKSIVVLPFEDMSPDKDNEYFSDGLTEEIIADLSNVKELLVISRSSAMTLKGSQKKIKDIAAEVNVRYVLEGSVRKSGNNLRITAQLIDARDESHLWADKFNGTLEDVFDLQEELSRKIVNALKLKLTPDEDRRLSERPINNVLAFESYLRARHQAYNNFSEESLNSALILCQDALKHAGENELLYSMMGQIYILYLLWGIKLDKVYLQKAKECSLKVSTINPGSSHDCALRGMIAYKLGDRNEAANQLKQAVGIAPDNSVALIWLVSIYVRSGSASAMRPLLNRLLEIDPLTPLVQAWVGWLAWLEGKSGPAVLGPQLKMYEMDPMNPYSRFTYGLLLAQNGKPEEFYPLVDLLDRDNPGHGFTRIGLFLRAALQGNKPLALQHVTESLERWAETDDMASWWMADGFALIDEKQKALAWLNNGVEQGLMNYPGLSKLDPLLENIRNEPQFADLLNRIKRKWEAFET